MDALKNQWFERMKGRVRGSDAKRDKWRAGEERGVLNLEPDQGGEEGAEKTESFHVP